MLIVRLGAAGLIIPVIHQNLEPLGGIRGLEPRYCPSGGASSSARGKFKSEQVNQKFHPADRVANVAPSQPFKDTEAVKRSDLAQKHKDPLQTAGRNLK